tara:strand:+ start:1312 stop:1539 length:228 start_codon:yes stop_codon:yes gene_type:complete
VDKFESPYKNGPFVVLSDGSTYDGAEDCVIAFVTDKGLETLEECYEFKGVEKEDVEYIMLSDLMDAYEKLHNVKL